MAHYTKRILAVLLSVILMSLEAESQTVTHHFENTRMTEALKVIIKKSHEYTINFLYNDLENYYVTTTIDSLNMADAIRQVIEPYPIRMIQDDNTHIITLECTDRKEKRYRGTVKSNDGRTLEYANIVLYSVQDKSFIAGGISDKGGLFSIPCKNDDVMMKISYVGYETQYIRCSSTDIGTVFMKENTTDLNPVTISCQTESERVLSYIQKAMNFNYTTSQEKVYLHFDNNGYFEDETVWWKAYVSKPSGQGSARPDSKVLYVELLNPSGDVLKTTKWPIDSLGQAHGDLKLDSLFGSGFYEIRAYTRYMTNWGVNACFSRVFPVFKAPKEEGEFTELTIKTKLYQVRDPNNRDRSDSLYLNAINDGISTNGIRKTISVQFFPEGGDLIVGKKSRVAMLAVDDNGRPYQGVGFVMNKDTAIVARVETDSLGRGLFEITPDSTTLTMQMHNMKKSVKRSVQYFDLPKAKTDGVALTLDAVNDSMLLTLQSTDRICGRLLGLVAMHDGEVYYCDTIKAAPRIEITLDRSRQKQGVNQFTVFDSRGQILAERLYFIYPEGTSEDSIYITSETKRLTPCGNVVLDVKTQPNSTFSFSAIDAKNMTNGKQGNMKTWMLLSSDVKGYIHNVDYYFEADDKEHRQSADLLMLTQGWRRYDWDIMTGQKTFKKVQPIEDKFYLYGKLNQYRKRNPAKNVGIEVFLYNEEGQSLTGKTVTDKEGNYAFDLPFMDGEWQMQIFTKREDKRKTYYVGIDRQFSPTPRYITRIEADIQPPLKPNMFVHKPNEETADAETFIPITERTHVLQNVTVDANYRYFTNNDWQYKNEGYGGQFATLFYDIDKERENLLDTGKPEPSIFAFLCKKNALFNNPNCEDLPTVSVDRWSGRMTYGNRPIKWIVDNARGTVDNDLGSKIGDVPHSLYSDNSGVSGDAFFPLWLHEIKHVYIVPDDPREKEGAVLIYLYLHHRFTTSSNKGLRRTYFQGFNIPSTFKMEDYSILPPMADFRRTIYWNPDVRTDAEGKAQIKFYNNSTCEEMYISAEGMTDTGNILVNKE